ncbi:hypothetical protein I5Q34_26840 [Streptomyces sp. AV19]|uniref:hypothetical protein n=1 Tax=Streptomyces sp. AV19 TaxID=2793068 RepID=UPI0018FE0A99|nr:hypothetical protein [Streptomyces sp. AV19]MBH1937844.1 hypothetical protein [Streptomyces sp. AV19]MDG4537122.1 hypothetical protein [Streptomyces sp. AV19]
MLLADGPCDSLAGSAKDYCTTGGGTGGNVTEFEGHVDPLTALAQEVAKAADWTSRQLGKAVADRNAVDFTNTGFLKQYAIVFAASAVLVLVLWLLAVAKRAIRGVPITTASSEAISLLWLAVLATAFTPLILYVVIGATSAVTDVLVSALGSKPGGLFNSLGGQLKDGKVGGGPLILTLTSLATIALCGALWLLLVLRALGLYVGALLGVVVYAGLVDKDLWGHIRRWAGFMVALILTEPVIVIVLGLASALRSTNERGPVVTGLAVTVIALGVSVYIIVKFPGFGDAMKVARMTARAAGGTARTITGAGSASAGVLHGIHTHGGRGSETPHRTPRQQTQPNTVSEGISAHSQRKPDKPKSKDDSGT